MPSEWSTAEAAGQGEEEDLFPVCVSCRAAEGTHERADGARVCNSCFCDAADHAYDRAMERQRGERA